MDSPHVEAFSDVNEMFASIRRGVERAKANTLHWQWKITRGDYWMRLWYDMLIFGYIMTKEELEQAERNLGASEEEIREENRMLDQSYADGFRFGRAYSVVEPDGELGDTHVSTMVPITKEEFEEAKENNWDIERISKLPWFSTAVERLRNA